MAISKEDIKPLAWSADDEPTFLKDDEKKDGKNGNVAGSVDTVLRARRTFKMKKGSGGRKKQSWKALNTRWVRARDEMFVNERFLEKVLQVIGRMRFGVKNSMLIALQNEKATRIATAASWRGLGVQLLPGAEAKPIWLDAGADTQRKTTVPSKWYDITQTDAGEKLTLKGTIYNTLAICRIVLNQLDELKIVEQEGVTGIHYNHEARVYLVQPEQMERAMLCCAALEALAEKDFMLVFQANEKTALPDTPANEIIAKCAAYIVCVHFGVLPQGACVRVPAALGTDKAKDLLQALSTAQSIAAQEIMMIENRLRSKKWRTI